LFRRRLRLVQDAVSSALPGPLHTNCHSANNLLHQAITSVLHEQPETCQRTVYVTRYRSGGLTSDAAVGYPTLGTCNHVDPLFGRCLTIHAVDAQGASSNRPGICQICREQPCSLRPLCKSTTLPSARRRALLFLPRSGWIGDIAMLHTTHASLSMTALHCLTPVAMYLPSRRKCCSFSRLQQLFFRKNVLCLYRRLII